ncbi:DNA-3-methyladenine glycosidase [Bacillus sp. FJAT-27264]|uniref:DNA-3-methyladenine glycosylase family protein n=1 Tax=Paenibacillus sp. (strain DSM 101736 / FJAT-27264) TaxID=1850362 RepID=UPI00080810A1|nr:DNA-3-methyladenine glycosylase [Bacillus sp. FJAT-27264]OBZ11672.1 DNA-3-methyladenine glycosidase [Bacillus sp. FJAT-27264]
MGTVVTKIFEYGDEPIEVLRQADGTLGAAMQRLGRVERVIIPDLFAALVHAIVGQLISVKAAATVWGRMQEQLGEITPQNLLLYTADDIQRCGMTMKKARCIEAIARTVAQGELDLESLRELSDQEVISSLTALPGIGRWTAEMLLINSMERPDIVSWGDIAIRRGMMELYGLNSLTREQFEQYRQSYSPWGSVASIYLWELSFE